MAFQSDLETTGKGKGSLVFPDDNEIASVGVKASTSLVVGDPITFDANGFAYKATDAIGTRSEGFGVVVQANADNSTGADGDIQVQFVSGNSYVYFTMGGVVPPFKLCKLNSSSKAVAHANPAGATTPTAGEVDAARDYFGKAFGRFWGHEKEEKIPTASAADDIGILRLGVD